MTEAEARGWPDLMAIVEAKVKPERLVKTSEVTREALVAVRATRGPSSTTRSAASTGCWRSAHGTSHTGAFASCPPTWSSRRHLSSSPLASTPPSALLQSGVHEVWARFFGSSMKDDCATRPPTASRPSRSPTAWQTDAALEAAGRYYYEFRAALMVRNNEGLTKTYNRFHDPDERDPDILKLRELHDAMDRAVLDA